MLPVRFSTPNEDGKDVLDKRIVLRISVHPDTTRKTSCRDANAPILAILAKHGIHDAAVHWIEGAVESLAGSPPMMRVVRDTDPTHWIRRALMAVLGVPLAAEQSVDMDAQGFLGIYFHESKDRHGDKSTRVMALTNKHVTSKDTTTDYEYSGRSDAPRQYIRNCSSRRFQQVINETRALIAKKLGDAKFFAEQLAELLVKPAFDQEEEAAEHESDLERKEQDLKRAKRDVALLAAFLKLLNSTWGDLYQRIIGWLDWAPKIANDLDNCRYARDIGVIAIDEAKLLNNFEGNVVYLGKFTRDEIVSFFYPNAADPPSFEYPKDHLFRILGCVDAAGLVKPYFYDEQGSPHYIVAKHGQTTDLTLGRCSELEAYTCDEFGHGSWEVAVLNFNREHGSFSDHGDSGACIFNAEGKMVAILHSAMPRGMSTHITFGTPAHYVVELVRKRCPHADLDRLKFAGTAG